MNYPINNKNNNNNLIHYSIQNNYINNNFNIQNPQRFINLNQGKYYPYIQPMPYLYMNNQINPNLFQYNNQYYYNPNLNINNNKFPQYNNKVNKPNTNIYQMKNNLNNQNIYNNLNNIDDVNLAKMSLNLIKTQLGFKILDERAKSNNKFANELLFPELINNLSNICCDILGNMLIQTLNRCVIFRKFGFIFIINTRTIIRYMPHRTWKSSNSKIIRKNSFKSIINE